MKYFIIIFLFSIVIFFNNQADAQEIRIAFNENAENIIFDGKWTFVNEWKPTSETKIEFDDSQKMAIKTVHDHNHIYVLIDFFTDSSYDRLGDRGIVCIDSNLEKNVIPDNENYCFLVSLGSDRPITLQGGSFLANQGYYSQIDNHPQLTAIGGFLENEDRYSRIPHSTYEFKIPIDIIGRSDIYGFYAGAFNAKNGNLYGWPESISNENYPFIPSPEMWGELISPDKSIPEFNFAQIALILAILPLFLLTKKFKRPFFW